MTSAGTGSNVVPRVGEVRPSQLMYSAGVGAVIDLPRLSVVVAGLDRWNGLAQRPLTEDRLLAAVRAKLGQQVRELREAPWEEPDSGNPFGSWASVGVPVLPFPRWLRCTRCNLLSTVDGGVFKLKSPSPYRPDLTHYEHSNCSTRGAPPAAVPARFVTACPNGHLDEFPWVEFCHTGRTCSGNPVLEVREYGMGSRSTHMQVICRTCEAQRPVNSAFGQQGSRVMPRCRGRHPHLQLFETDGCSQQARAMLLGASNQWFAVTESVLSLPISNDPLPQLVAELWAPLSAVVGREALDAMLRYVPELRPLAGFDPDRMWAAIEARRATQGGNASGEAPDLRLPEWLLFIDPLNAPRSRDFKLADAGVPGTFQQRIDRVVLAERLREVVALRGFTRVDGPDSGVATDAASEHVAPLSRNGKPEWVPAAEVRGEGLFLQLPEDAVAAWVDRVAGSVQTEALRESHKRWRAHHHLDPATGWPGERYVLIHSLAHSLLNELALECGYAAASIRERIYARDPEEEGGPMAGLLLYTAAPDSEGTLGGLVGLGKPATL
ncbi:MAG: DrmB family protein, partial [Dehalococcoidia bacterium]